MAGHVYAMVGASEPHNRIALNLATALNVHLRGGVAPHLTVVASNQPVSC